MLKKRSLFRDKKAQTNIWSVLNGLIMIISFVIILALVFILLIKVCNSMVHSNIEKDISQPGWKGELYKSGYNLFAKLGFNTNADYIAKYGTCGGWLWSSIMNTLGFVGRFIMGFIAGFWLWSISHSGDALLAWTAKFREGKGAQRSRWIKFIAGHAWKMPAIGLGYAILMQIPIVSFVIKIITLEVFGFSGIFSSLAVVPVVIAFWVGLAPSWIEEYYKYRIRIRAEKAVEFSKARQKLESSSMQ